MQSSAHLNDEDWTPSASAQSYKSATVAVSHTKRRCRRLPSGRRSTICAQQFSAGTKEAHDTHQENTYLIHARAHGRLWGKCRSLGCSPSCQQSSLLLCSALRFCHGSSLSSLLRLALGQLARRGLLQLFLTSGTLLVGAQRGLILRVLLGPKLTVEVLLCVVVRWRAAERAVVSTAC